MLEILGRTRGLKIAEVPFTFGERHAGESKASLREGLAYLRQLVDLRVGAFIGRLSRFAVVGLSGIPVNMLLIFLLTEGAGLDDVASAILATQGSTLWNFVLAERWVFRDRTRNGGRIGRAAKFFLVNNVALVLRVPMLFVLTSLLGVN